MFGQSGDGEQRVDAEGTRDHGSVPNDQTLVDVGAGSGRRNTAPVVDDAGSVLRPCRTRRAGDGHQVAVENLRPQRVAQERTLPKTRRRRDDRCPWQHPPVPASGDSTRTWSPSMTTVPC